MNKLAVALNVVEAATVVVRTKRRVLRREMYKASCKAVHVKQVDEVERDLAAVLAPMFERQIKSMSERLGDMGGKSIDSLDLGEYLYRYGFARDDSTEISLTYAKSGKEEATKVIASYDDKEHDYTGELYEAIGSWEKDIELKYAADAAANLVGQIFDPREWRDELIDRALPVLAVNMFKAAAATLLAVGVDVRRKSVGVSEKQVEVGESTTASQWLNEHPEDIEKFEEMLGGTGVPIGIVTEMPTWMKKSVAGHLTKTFQQPYWDKISEATGGDAERYLRKGLEEGQSIRQMANAMAGSFQGETAKYAKMRATRIARTESGNALNGARDVSYNALKEELGEAGKHVGKSWLSVLGTTTRDTHADADGQLADVDGNFTVGGYTVPWPGHYTLPPEERINCFPEGTLVSGDFVGAQRGWYEGVFTEIVLRCGRRFSLTPNHPVVTSQGFVPAGKVKPGQKILTYGRKVDIATMVASCGNKVENKPVSIEQIFEAFLAGAVAGPTCVEVVRTQVDDFHGDGVSFQGNVDVVGSNWKLLEDGIIGQFEKCGDTIFVLESAKLPFESSSGSCGFAEGGIDIAATSGPCLAEPRLRRRIGSVTPAGSLAIGIAADFNARLDKSAIEDGPTISGFLREALQRYSRSVAFDDVVEVRDFYSAGHVYDLQSRYGIVVAYGQLYNDIGIVSSNCHCTILTELGVGAPEEEIEALVQEQEGALREEAVPFVARMSLEARRVGQEIVGGGVETGVVLDKRGKELFRQSGTSDMIEFSSDQVDKMLDGTLVHNHPSVKAYHGGKITDLPLSGTDGSLLCQAGLSEIHAVGENYRFILKRQGTASSYVSSTKSIGKDWTKEVRRFERNEAAKINRRVKAGKMTHKEADVHLFEYQQEAQHKAWLEIKDVYALDYERLPL